MKNKKILRIMDDLVADAKEMVKEETLKAELGHDNELPVVEARFYCLAAAQGRFEQEIKREQDAKRNTLNETQD